MILSTSSVADDVKEQTTQYVKWNFSENSNTLIQCQKAKKKAPKTTSKGLSF